MPKHYGDITSTKLMPRRKNVATKLTAEQEKMLKKHSASHSLKHMTAMRRLMKQGRSFSQAHREATAMVGK